MARAPFPYEKLPGTGRSRGGKATLWMGEDHLLSVKSIHFAEEYRRFYYRDIQAIVLQQKSMTARRMVDVLVLLILALFAFLSLNSLGWLLWWVVLLATYLILAMRAADSVCYLQTQVSVTELPSLSRFGVAQEVLARIRAKVEEAQGALPPVGEPAPAPLESAPLRSKDEAPMADQAPFRDRGALHLIGFLILLVTAGLKMFGARGAPSTVSLALFPLYAATLGTLVTALIRQPRSTFGQSVRMFTIAAVGGTGIVALVSGGYQTIMLSATQMDPRAYDFYRRLGQQPFLNMGAGILLMVLAFAGLLSLWLAYRASGQVSWTPKTE